METVLDLLKNSARRLPNKPALVFGSTRITYAQLETLSDRASRLLASWGVGMGTRVAVVAGNSAELVIVLFAIWKRGGVLMDWNPAESAHGLRLSLERAAAEALVCERGHPLLQAVASAANLRSLPVVLIGAPSTETVVTGVETDSQIELSQALGDPKWTGRTETTSPRIGPETLACISYTTGSTSVPRGVRLPHVNLIRNAELNVKYLNIREQDCVCLVLPLFFGMNRASLLAFFWCGATVVLQRGFVDPNGVLSVMRQEGVDSFSAVPGMLQTLLKRGDFASAPVPELRSIRMGAGGVSPHLVAQLRERFSRADLYVTYGLTEIGLVTVLANDQVESRPGSCGHLLDEVEVEITPSLANGAAGEVIVRGSHAASGYEDADDETRRVFRPNGIYTGDLGRLDSEGFLYLVGRSKELVKSAGESILPGEIEAFLRNCPGVAECAVIGVPDRSLGEALLAFVLAEQEFELDAKDVETYCRRGLSWIKRPREIRICAQFPRTHNGKIDKRALALEAASFGKERRRET